MQASLSVFTVSHNVMLYMQLYVKVNYGLHINYRISITIKTLNASYYEYI